MSSDKHYVSPLFQQAVRFHDPSLLVAFYPGSRGRWRGRRRLSSSELGLGQENGLIGYWW
jgi:hypothetical protein